MTLAPLARAATSAAVVFFAGCAASSPSASNGGAGRIVDFRISPDNFKVDRVGSGDGSLDPDGVPDAVFDVTVDGPVNAFALLVLDAGGKPIGQWDTLTGADKFPHTEGLYSANGDTSFGLVLYEGGARLNQNDGSLAPLAAGRHTVQVVAGIRDVDAARGVRLVIEGPDGSLSFGPILAFQVPSQR